MSSGAHPGSAEGRRIAGVGIDVESRDALARYPDDAIRSFAERWLTPAERAWCERQPAMRPAIVACVCGKEAVWKASGGAAGLDRIEVASRRGLRRSVRIGDLRVELSWGLECGSMVVTALASDNGARADHRRRRPSVAARR